MKPPVLLSNRRGVLLASNEILDELLPVGGAYRAADLRRIAERLEDRLLRHLNPGTITDIVAHVLSYGDGQRLQVLVRLRRTAWAWVLEEAEPFERRWSQREQIRLVDHRDPKERGHWSEHLRKRGVMRVEDGLDMRSPATRAVEEAEAGEQDPSYVWRLDL